MNIEVIQPFYFGTSQKPLFGSYQPPQSGSARRSVVLLCYPLGDEYIRAHRAYRQLATRLNRVGFPVMRFDYFGSGDSAGEDTDATLSQWLNDISIAVDEAKRLSGAQTVILAGLRLGATLAAITASQRRDVSAVALWEPVINGDEYLNELREAHEHRLRYLPSKPQNQPQDLLDLLGFRLSDKLVEELQHLNLLTLSAKPSNVVYMTENRQTEELSKLQAHFKNLGSRVYYDQIDGPVIWAEDPDKALVPHQILESIVSWMAKEIA